MTERRRSCDNSIGKNSEQTLKDSTVKDDNDEVSVPRKIGFPGASAFIVGSIIGSGIFISPSGVAYGSGSSAMCLINWFLYGVISMMGGLSYAELGVVVQESGADYVVLHKAFGSLASYMFAWVEIFIILPANMATLALACAVYITTPLMRDGCGDAPDYVVIPLAAFFILTLAAISFRGTDFVTRIAVLFTVIKLIAMAIIIIGGIFMMSQGHVETLRRGFDGTESNINKIVIGFYSGMWAYGGWDSVNFFVEDVKNPRRNIPLSIISGLVLVIVAYILVNVSYMTVMSFEEILHLQGVAVTWADRVIPKLSWIIPIFVACSTFGSGNACLFTSGRTAMVAARKGHVPEVLGMIHRERHTPTVTYIITVVLALAFLLSNSIRGLIEVVGFVRWGFYGLSMIALILFRYRTKYRYVERSFYLPLIVPILTLAVSVFVVVVSVALNPSIEILSSLSVIGLGVVFYIPFIYFKLRMPYFVSLRSSKSHSDSTSVSSASTRANGDVTKTNLDDSSSVTSVASQDSKTVAVPRTIGLIGGISFIVGTIIGSGIFIAPKGLAEGSGSVGLSLVSWAACGIVSMLAALCYAELGTVVKQSGADYAFLQAAYGPVISFMMAWVYTILLKPATIATLMLTCSQYILTLMFDDGCGNVPKYIKILLALTVLFFLVSIHVYSTRVAGKIQIIFTVAKLVALLVIIIGGIVMLAQGHTEHLSTGFENTETNPGTIAVGLYSGMFAYDGWNAANFITEEIINPERSFQLLISRLSSWGLLIKSKYSLKIKQIQKLHKFVNKLSECIHTRNLPLAIIIGVPLVTIIYVLTNISYFTVMSVDQLIASPAVAVTWAEAVMPAAAFLIPIFVALSTFGSANGTLFGTGRLVFVAARNGHLPGVFNMIQMDKFTPIPASLMLAFFSIILILFANVDSLITYLSFLKWIFYGMNMISLIIFRYSKQYKDLHRPLRIPLVIPVFVFICAVFIVVVPIIADPQIEFLYAAIFVVCGLIFYVPFVHFKLRLGFMDYITKFCQLLMRICTPVRETL